MARRGHTDSAIHQHHALATFLGLTTVAYTFLHAHARADSTDSRSAMTAVYVLLACQGLVGMTQYTLELPAEMTSGPRRARRLTSVALLVATAARPATPARHTGAGRPRSRRRLAPSPVRAPRRRSARLIGSHLVDALLAQGGL